MLALFKQFLAWALTFLAQQVKKEDPKLMEMSINLPSLGPVPLSAFEQLGELFPVIVNGLKANKSAAEIKADLDAALPAVALSVAENVLNIAFPGSGTLLECLAWLVQNSKNSQMTQEEVNAWMDRFGANNA